MPAWLAPLIMGAADIVGGLMTKSSAEKGQRRANEQNIALAREQMAFQERMAHSAESFSERMANTQMQRRVQDLKEAGLNPALAYESGAAAPTGVTAGGSQARVENTVSSGMQALAIRQQIQAAATAIKNQTDATRAEVKAKSEAAKLTEAQRKQVEQAIDFARINQPHQTRALELQNIVSQLGITGLENEQELEEKLKALPGGSSKTLISLIRSIIRPR